MPGDTDGVNLVAQIAVTCPTITLLVTSGRSEGVLERLPPNGFFVPKPWSATDLDQAIDHIRRRQQ
ncbi:hypothetical protein [Lichenihabitans psoromatis]|nr:hypothetical protein [Lichenihabitans psoromatis]